jgi:hypothetical protein
MISGRKKPGVAFWATVVVVVVLAYPLSYGPVCWFDLRQERLPRWARPVVWYVWRPMGFLAVNGPRPIKRAIQWWASLGQQKAMIEPATPRATGEVMQAAGDEK